MKEPRLQVENQVMMKDQLKKEIGPETYGTLRRNMMRDGPLTKTKDGKMKREAKMKACGEIIITSKER